ncbi:MAG TPA: molybdopterin-dependent oxidoreductase [Anaerolineae bacterium]|nr:molybdopterin-dependent oxidoreductase [Anaerolineae bacterium]
MRQYARFVCFFMLLFVVGCGADGGDDADLGYEVIAAGEIGAGDEVPMSTGEPVLTVSGDIGSTNEADLLVLDMETLEKMRLVSYTLVDPFLETEVTYSGVLMSDLVEMLEIGDGATMIHMTALDDYAVDISLADIEKWPIMLATKVDGEYLDIEAGGPIRIIYPYHVSDELDPVEYNPLWIWQIETMEVK